MMFRTAAIALFFASTVTAEAEPKTLCFSDYELDMELGPDDCNPRTIEKKIKELFLVKKRANRQLPKKERTKCDGYMNSQNEVQALTGTSGMPAARKAIIDMCEEALDVAADNKLGDTGFDVGVSNDEYYAGRTFLNTEVGNFQQDEEEFLKRGGEDKFLYVGTDPRENDHYPTSEESYAAGQKIKEIFDEDSKNKFFDASSEYFENGCSTNTAMCCWHKDRQYFDDNGGCSNRDCAHENPGDNTDLCWTNVGDEVFPYPGDGTEQDLHCHGISWGDVATNDINTRARWNSLFYVSMVDHLYTRGYSESLTDDPKIAGEIPMCGCIEDMAPVARADCNEVVGRADFTATIESDQLVITAVEETFELKFQACKGFDYKDDFGPEDYLTDADELDRSDNDLSAFVFKQWLKGKLNDAKVYEIEETLVGYRDPSVNNSDKNRAEACARAFEERYPDEEYEEKEIE